MGEVARSERKKSSRALKGGGDALALLCSEL
jgi:hypothetical protein